MGTVWGHGVHSRFGLHGGSQAGLSLEGPCFAPGFAIAMALGTPQVEAQNCKTRSGACSRSFGSILESEMFEASAEGPAAVKSHGVKRGFGDCNFVL